MNEVLPDKADTRINEADLNTKVHAAPRFNFLVDLLGLRRIKAETLMYMDLTKSVESSGSASTGGVMKSSPEIDKKTLALAIAFGELM
eukprot:216128-Karenia_brevis.AAC.1